MTASAVLLKLGGSFITDKRRNAFLHEERVRFAGREIAAAQRAAPELRLIVGHGAGSFGHVLARDYQAVQGIHPHYGWQGFHAIRRSMAGMNLRVLELLAAEGCWPIALQPSAFMTADNGRIAAVEFAVFDHVLACGQMPLIHGDIVLDRSRGFTIISTEAQFRAIAAHCPIEGIVMITDVPGILAADGSVIRQLHPAALATTALGGAAGADVTGGMRHKVESVFELLRLNPQSSARIISGLGRDGSVRDAILGQTDSGTLLTL